MIKNRYLFITYALTTALTFNIITCDALSQWRYPDINATVQAAQQWARKNRILLASITTILAGAIIWKFMQQQPFTKTYYIKDGAYLTIKQGLIDKEQVEVIVNAANEQLERGGGICGGIFEAAGEQAEKLTTECKKYTDAHGRLPAGHALYTPIDYPEPSYVTGIIHAVSPTITDSVYQARLPITDETAALLKSAYTNALKLAQLENVYSIAFPLLGSGAFGFHNWDDYNAPDNPVRPALQAIVEFAQSKEHWQRPTHIRLVLFTDKIAHNVNDQLQKNYPNLKLIRSR